jgi:Transcription factor PAP1
MEQAHKQETDRLLETNQNLMSLIQKLEAEIVQLKSKTVSSNIASLSINTPESSADNMRSDYSGSPRSEDRIRDPDAMDILTSPQEEVSTSRTSSLGSRRCGSGCHTTKDGVTFCEKLKDEVCTSAYERLLSESIFDNSGQVNHSIDPVPIVTSPINDDMEHSRQRHTSKFSTFRRNFLPDSPEEDSDEYDLASGTSDAFKHDPHPVTKQPGKQLITCSQVWERLCEHPQFEEFDIDELCTQLKLKAKCSGSGPVIEEDELHEVLEALESKLARDSRL